jgi:hypothetical protein
MNGISAATDRRAAPANHPGMVLALAMLLTFAVPACTSQRPAASHPQATSAAPGPVTGPGAAEALLTDNVPMLLQEWDLGRAQQRLTADCMHRLGLRYLPPEEGLQPAPGTVTDDAVGAGPHTYGVRIPSARFDPEDAYIKQLVQAQQKHYSAALLGTSGSQLKLPGGLVVGFATDGCLSAARGRLFGSARAYMLDFYLPQAIKLLFDSYLAKYVPYAAALSRWQRCMTSAGLRYKSPDSAIQAFQVLAARRGAQARVIQSKQQAVATKDAVCDGLSGLRLQKHSGLVAYIHHLPGSLLSEFQEIFSTRRRAVQVAQRLLRVGPAH